MAELKDMLEREEPWSEKDILGMIRGHRMPALTGSQMAPFQARLVLESIRAINRFNLHSTILAVAILAIAIVQVVVMLAR